MVSSSISSKPAAGLEVFLIHPSSVAMKCAFLNSPPIISDYSTIVKFPRGYQERIDDN